MKYFSTSRMFAATLNALLGAAAAHAQLRPDVVPPEAEGINIVEQIDAQVPLDLAFTDENSNPVTLAKYFDGQRPVILTLNYFGCPMLCGEQLNGMLATLKELPWTAGREFQVLTVSFEPLEGPNVAHAKKQAYLAEYGRPEGAAGWHFLTGKRENIRALTQSVGFNFKWNPERNEWSHSAALILLTPKGRVARYLGGIMYDAKTLRMSLVEASEGKVGSLADQFFMWCFHWDPKSGRYTAAALNLMALAGGTTVVLLGAGLFFLWRREYRRPAPGGLPGSDSASISAPPPA